MSVNFPPIEILYEDSDLVAVNKPHDLLVHRTRLAEDAHIFALQILRDQLGKHVFPVHRLDRKTAGIVLFGLSADFHKAMQQKFAEREVTKKYLAIVRGFTENQGTVDYPLRKENGKMQEAITHYKTLDQAELNIPFGRHNTSRYSLLELQPVTGRKHQIRRHLAHIRHPIIADRPHGCNKQNKMFKENFGLMTMMLHALELQFNHPITGKKVIITADLQDEFKRMIEALGFEYPA